MTHFHSEEFVPEWGIYWRSTRINTEMPCILQEVEGLLDSPEVRTGDLTLLQRDGQIPGTDYLGARSITVTAQIFDADRAAFARHISQIVGDLASGGREEPLQIKIPGVGDGDWCVVHARVRKRALTLDQDYYGGCATLTVEFGATDPRIYSVRQLSVDTTPPSRPGAGFAFPLTFDVSFDRPGGVLTRSPNTPSLPSTRTAIARNNGRTATPPELRIYGPCKGITIAHREQRRSIAFAPEFAIEAGAHVLLDAKNRKIVMRSSESDPGRTAYPYLAPGSQFFDLQPGDNSLSITAIDTAPPDQERRYSMNIRWHDAWV
ncbi:hypothetical protein GCM10012275_08090 [Longimycelium tulufanense]|uniref:Siphovirus-type tail component C-terminal domain-containing protein n=1 Tax=Longimycelium tulufanense TaxID=907463 RepID=A0A8J3FSK6_9PSEU|nr:phage tail domain-containing protein [Longimycelium tulufanense]GGM39606.1 hypothetical protein GCM10012275_08090 [Longimycelium tulufanense]